MNHEQSSDPLAVEVSGDDVVVAALAEAFAMAPPVDLRQRLIAGAADRPRPQVAPVAAPELYAGRVAAMTELLAALAHDDWSMPAAPYAWSVRELVAHLAVIEEYSARQFGLTDRPPLPVAAESTLSHLELGIDVIAELAAQDPTTVVQRWSAAAACVLDHVLGPSFDPTAPVPLHAWPFDAATALVVRSFEVWTHADDIRRATGRPLDVPMPGELRTMSSTSVGGIPVLLAVTNGPPARPMRVVLTGPGGGTYDLAHGTADPDDRHLLVVDVVDYCRMVARRIDPELLAHQREGDPGFLDAVLRAARAIAV